MNNLFDNKLFLQYLAAAGQDIMSGNPLGTNVNQVTMQNIAAQNYAGLLKKLLAGGGSVQMDSKGTKLNIPHSPGVSAGAGVGANVGTGASMLPFLLAGQE